MNRTEIDFQDLFQAICHPVMILDDNYTILNANLSTYDTTSLGEDALIGKKCYQLFHQTEAPPDNCPYQKMCSTGHWEIAEMDVEALDKTFIASCAPLVDSNGKLEKVIHLLTDISDLKQTESCLSNSVAQLQSFKSLAMNIARTMSVEDVIQAALDELSKMQPAEIAVIYLLENEEMTLRGELASFDCKNRIGSSVNKVGECLCGLAAEGVPIYSDNILEDERCVLPECREAGIKSFAALPLPNGNGILGVLGLGSREEGAFAQHHEFLETIALEIAIGLMNASLYDQVENHTIELENAVQEKTEDLRRALRVMVGRENRMAELKKTIKVLRKQLIDAGLNPVEGDPLQQ